MSAAPEQAPRDLYTWMLEHLQEGLRGAHFLIAAAVCGTAFLLYMATGLQGVLVWAGYLLVCEALLGACMLAGLPPHRWIRCYAPVHLLACVGWGLVPVLFFSGLPPAYQHLYALLVAAAAVVSLPTLSYVPRLYMTGAALMLLPVAAMLADDPPEGQFVISVGLAVFLVVGVVLLGVRVIQQHRILRGQVDELLSLEQARSALREHQSRLREERERVEQAGNWDPVTGTLAQSGFMEQLDERVQAHGVLVVCLRIAGFKYVNMAFGREVGDEVLREIAARLVRLAGDPWRVCRTGGGEYLAFFDAPRPELERELMRLCDRACITASGPVTINAYIGMSLLARGEHYMDGLYSALDAAEKAKEDGDRRVRTLAPADQASQRNRSLMRFELCEAVGKNEFHLVFQPQHRLGDGALIGFEALLRWESSAFGTVSPGEFIPVAEEAGIISEIGTWVLRSALSAFQKNLGNSDISLSLNISLAQLEASDFVERINYALDQTGFAPQRLILEITESTFMASPEVIRERLCRLRARGVRVALDDFGTGYSSLSQLAHIPLDEMKIDRTFVMSISEDRVSRTLVTSLLRICEALDIRAVIEGVEQQRQLDQLNDFPRVVIQGFFFARPMPLDQTLDYVREHSALPG